MPILCVQDRNSGWGRFAHRVTSFYLWDDRKTKQHQELILSRGAYTSVTEALKKLFLTGKIRIKENSREVKVRITSRDAHLLKIIASTDYHMKLKIWEEYNRGDYDLKTMRVMLWNEVPVWMLKKKLES